LIEITEVDPMARTVRVRRKVLEEVKEILETDSDEDAITEALLRVVRGRRYDDFLKRMAKLEGRELQEAWDQEVHGITPSA
jgi:hypothetical protein